MCRGEAEELGSRGTGMQKWGADRELQRPTKGALSLCLGAYLHTRNDTKQVSAREL